jgi:hypothetical protein
MAPPVVAVRGYTNGVGTCLMAAMEKFDLEPYALVRSTTIACGADASVLPRAGGDVTATSVLADILCCVYLPAVL